jgi:hypothetical protein
MFGDHLDIDFQQGAIPATRPIAERAAAFGSFLHI